MKTQTFYIIIAFILVACTPASNEPRDDIESPTPTDSPVPVVSSPTAVPPTATPAPMTLEGYVFLDLNANGVQDMASGYCPDATAVALAQKHLQETGVDLFAALHTYLPDACTAENVGQIFTATEPPLGGINISSSDASAFAVTDNNGYFQLVLNAEMGRKVTINFADPNTNPDLAMRYYIYGNKVFYTIGTGINVTTGNNIGNTGLMLGPYTESYPSGLVFKPELTNYIDLDLVEGGDHAIDWLGNKTPIKIGPIIRSWDQIVPGVYDQHQGVDLAMPIGTPLVAKADGSILLTSGGSHAALNITQEINIPGDPTVYVLQYGHNSENILLDYEFAHRGDVIALSGDSNGARPTNPHVHTNYFCIERILYNELISAGHTQELFQYIFGEGAYSGNGRAVPFKGRTVGLNCDPYLGNMFTLGRVPIFSTAP